MIGQRQPENQSHHHKTQDYEPRDWAVLGSLTLPTAHHPGALSQQSLLLCQLMLSPQTIYFWVLDKNHSQALEGVSLPATTQYTWSEHHIPQIKGWVPQDWPHFRQQLQISDRHLNFLPTVYMGRGSHHPTLGSIIC